MTAAPRVRAAKLPWGLLALVAARLALRERPPGRRVRQLAVLTLAATALAAGALLAGVHSLVLAGVLGVASMLALAAVALRWFPPAMAVSVVGIALSCASLMTALAVTTGFLAEISRTISRFNGHILLTKYGLDFTEYEAVAAELREDPRVVAASPFAYSMVVLVRDDGTAIAPTASALATAPPRPRDDDAGWDAALDADAALPVQQTPLGSTAQGADAVERTAIVVGKGIDPRFAGEFQGLAPAFGRRDLSGLRPGDSRWLPGLVLGRALRRELGVEIGDRVRVVVPAQLDGGPEGEDPPPRHAVFELTDELDTGIIELDRNLALMHLSAAQSLFFRAGRVTGIEFEIADPEQAQAVADGMSARLPPLYRASTWREANADMFATLMQIRVAVSLVLGLMGIVGAASLVASLLLVVRRKQHDIGVLLALGCDARGMFWLFEAVGLLVGGVGVVLGLGLGALYCAVIARYHFPLSSEVYPIDHLPTQVALADVAVPAGIALVLCAIASGPIAVLATRVRILGALKR
ncbi:MAG: ABC transporter permease [Nannocystaceae bacterium]|nr:ABC transporter permease [Nannocystaceae bacterium]